MTKTFWIETSEALILAITAHPGARHPQIGPAIPATVSPGWPPSRLKIAISAPPEDGRANAAIIQALADWLHIKPSAITQESGLTARDKKFRIAAAQLSDFERLFNKIS
jgi:uncharacterized protein YggU (UPF0235/DUF167 family)